MNGNTSKKQKTEPRPWVDDAVWFTIQLATSNRKHPRLMADEIAVRNIHEPGGHSHKRRDIITVFKYKIRDIIYYNRMNKKMAWCCWC